MTLATAKKRWRHGMALLSKLDWLDSGALTAKFRDRLWAKVNALDALIKQLDMELNIKPRPSAKDCERFTVEVERYLKKL